MSDAYTADLEEEVAVLLKERRDLEDKLRLADSIADELAKHDPNNELLKRWWT